MTQPQDQYRELVQQSQEAFQGAVETWTKTVRDTMDSAGDLPNRSKVDPEQVVDQVFDFAERMLAMQRDLTRTLIQSSVALQQSVARPSGQDGAQTREG